jgi:hypothetical protein
MGQSTVPAKIEAVFLALLNVLAQIISGGNSAFTLLAIFSA